MTAGDSRPPRLSAILKMCKPAERERTSASPSPRTSDPAETFHLRNVSTPDPWLFRRRGRNGCANVFRAAAIFESQAWIHCVIEYL